MDDKFMKELEDLVRLKDREELEKLYFGALQKGDWRQCHDLLLKLIVLLLETNIGTMAKIRVQQEETARQIKAMEKRLDSLGGRNNEK